MQRELSEWTLIGQELIHLLSDWSGFVLVYTIQTAVSAQEEAQLSLTQHTVVCSLERIKSFYALEPWFQPIFLLSILVFLLQNPPEIFVSDKFVTTAVFPWFEVIVVRSDSTQYKCMPGLGQYTSRSCLVSIRGFRRLIIAKDVLCLKTGKGKWTDWESEGEYGRFS